MYGKAREKVEEILAQPQVDRLPGDVEDKLDQILRKAERELVGN
jgi:hypothetical protein